MVALGFVDTSLQLVQTPRVKATGWNVKDSCSISPFAIAFAMQACKNNHTPHVYSVNPPSHRITPKTHNLFIVYPAVAFEF